jgi:hypothetical protein
VSKWMESFVREYGVMRWFTWFPCIPCLGLLMVQVKVLSTAGSELSRTGTREVPPYLSGWEGSWTLFFGAWLNRALSRRNCCGSQSASGSVISHFLSSSPQQSSLEMYGSGSHDSSLLNSISQISVTLTVKLSDRLKFGATSQVLRFFFFRSGIRQHRYPAARPGRLPRAAHWQTTNLKRNRMTAYVPGIFNRASDASHYNRAGRAAGRDVPGQGPAGRAA